MKRLRITVVLLGLIFMSFSANAEEAFSENTLDEFENEILLDENEEQDVIQNEELSIIDENLLDESLDYTLDKDNDFYSEITDIEDSKLLSAVRDEYEDNDTMETAYAYAATKPVNSVLRTEGSLYSLGMRAATLYSADDEDWFRMNYQAGDYLFVDLRNIGKKNINFAIYAPDGTQEWDSIEHSEFNGRPEKYTDYQVTKSGVHYIKIYSSGDTFDGYYYFYFGPKYNQKYSYNIQMKAAEISRTGTISSQTTNFRKIFPTTAEASSAMTLTPYASTSSGLAYLEEMEIEINGIPYRSRDIDGRVGIKGAELYATCSLGGKLKLSKYGIVTWAPTARGYFTCIMEPYPGNKLK